MVVGLLPCDQLLLLFSFRQTIQEEVLSPRSQLLERLDAAL
jgi:hypothetical protein